MKNIYVVHLSADLWSSILRESVLGVRVQYIDEDWTLQHGTIGFRAFSNRHTGEHIRDEFEKIISGVGIKTDQVKL